jgi:hypothetical protein
MKRPSVRTRRVVVPDVPVAATPARPPAEPPPQAAPSPTDLDDETIRAMLESAYTF